MIDHLMKEFHKLITIQKEFLPKRAKRANYPSIVWIEAPLHSNFCNNPERVKFNRELNNVARFHENNFVLQLKKFWDPADSSLYASEYRRYTNEGLTSYWTAIDLTVKFADTILLKKKKKQNQSVPQIEASVGGRQKMEGNPPVQSQNQIHLNHDHPDYDQFRKQYRHRDRRNRSPSPNQHKYDVAYRRSSGDGRSRSTYRSHNYHSRSIHDHEQQDHQDRGDYGRKLLTPPKYYSYQEKSYRR